MDTSIIAHSKVSAQDDLPEKLMVSGLVYLEREDSSPVEVRRDMTILTREGQPAGKVAAVVIDNDSQKVTHVLLGRLQPGPEYRLVPVDLIEQVHEETVRLDIWSEAVESLPIRQTS